MSSITTSIAMANALAAHGEDATDEQLLELEECLRDRYGMRLGTTAGVWKWFDGKMRLHHDRLDAYWWLPTRVRPRDVMSMNYRNTPDLIRYKAVRLWHKFWSEASNKDRSDAIVVIYIDVRRDWIPPAIWQDLCMQSPAALEPAARLRRSIILGRIAEADTSIMRIWYAHCRWVQWPLSMRVMRIAAEMARTDDLKMTAILRGGRSTPKDLPSLSSVAPLWPAMVAVMIGALNMENGLRIAHQLDGVTARFFRIAAELPADLQLVVAGFINSWGAPRDEDILLVEGAIV